jgi:hypothetical protein
VCLNLPSRDRTPNVAIEDIVDTRRMSLTNRCYKKSPFSSVSLVLFVNLLISMSCWEALSQMVV